MRVETDKLHLRFPIEEAAPGRQRELHLVLRLADADAADRIARQRRSGGEAEGGGSRSAGMAAEPSFEEALAELETDKVTLEVNAPAAGEPLRASQVMAALSELVSDDVILVEDISQSTLFWRRSRHL